MAESTIGPVIAVKGEAEFKAAMASINNEFKLLGSEMKLAVSQFDKNDKSTAALTAQNKVLGKEIDTAKGKISLLTAQYDKQNSGLAALKTKLDATKAAFSADSAEVAKAQSAYDKQNRAVTTLQTELNKANTGLNNMDKALKSNNQLLDEGAKKHGVFGAASEKLGLNLGNLKTAFGAVGIAVGTYLVGAIGKAGEVEASTSRLTKLLENQGISADEAGQDIKSFTASITSMSTFSGGEAREALQVLTEKGMESGNALKNAGLLADIAAGQNTSLASAADLLANAYNGKTKALTALGILSKEEVAQLGDTEDATITMADVQQRLNDRFGGSAQADRATVNGQMKVMTNQMDSAKVVIGTALLPLLADLAIKLSEIVIPIVNFIKENPNFTAAIAGTVVALGILVGGMSVATTVMAFMTPIAAGLGISISAIVWPVLAVVAAIALLVAGGVLLYKHWDDLALGAQMAWANITGSIQLAWDSIMLGVTAAMTNIQNFISSAWNNIVSTVTGLVNGLIASVTGVFGLMAEGLGMIMTGLQEVFGGIWDLIIQIFAGAVILIIDLLTGNFTKLQTDTAGIWNNIKNDFQKVWDGIKLIFSGAILAVTNVLSAGWNSISQLSTTTWNNIKTGISNIWSSINSSISGSIDNVKNSLINGLDAAWSYIQGIPSQAASWGRDIISGLIDGMQSLHIPKPDFNFSISYRDIGGGVSFPVPHVDVEWYDQGGVFTRPSVIGIGEKRPEFVGALDDLKYIVRSEIERSGSKGQPAAAGVTVQNMYVRNDQDIKSVARELYNLQQQTSRGRGLA